MKLSESAILSKIKHLAALSQFMLTKHARLQMIERNMTTDDVQDILSNPSSVLRVNDDNLDGITSYKIKGGTDDHRLAIKFISNQNDESMIVITVMDNQGKK